MSRNISPTDLYPTLLSALFPENKLGSALLDEYLAWTPAIANCACSKVPVSIVLLKAFISSEDRLELIKGLEVENVISGEIELL